jgi:hypothetical protein
MCIVGGAFLQFSQGDFEIHALRNSGWIKERRVEACPAVNSHDLFRKARCGRLQSVNHRKTMI